MIPQTKLLSNRIRSCFYALKREEGGKRMSNAPPEKHLKKKRNGLSVTVASIGLWRTIHPVSPESEQTVTQGESPEYPY